MGIKLLKWEGFGTKNWFTHISTLAFQVNTLNAIVSIKIIFKKEV